ncbi:radical SAM domain protein [delta proteobacterium NaphS2]|nr:radical SAM domain protein [delta proteobacterium NaphS2]
MTDSILKLCGHLFMNALRFGYFRQTGKAGKPQALSLEVTHRCIAKCIMCNIWKIPEHVEDMSLKRWVAFLSSDLFSELIELDITGGEPFLRKDLADLIGEICRLKKENFTKLKSIAITTNGLLTGRVLEASKSILENLRPANLDLVMVCAMDAVGPIHDRVRCYPDAWKRVHETISGLKNLRDQYPNLIIGLKTTVLPINVNELEAISSYANENGLFTIISPCIITPARYLNPDRSEDLAFDGKMKRAMIDFFRSDAFRWSFHAEALARYLETGIMKKPCTCGFNYLFVRSTGEMLLCPLMGQSPGNIHDDSVTTLFHGQKARRIRRRIGKSPECLSCTEPGLERYALPYQGLHYLFILVKQGRKDFLNLHRHMGLNKYFESG